MAFTLARFLDVSDGVQENQFTVGSREQLDSLEDLDPIYKQLLDEPVIQAGQTPIGRGRQAFNLTPVWFKLRRQEPGHPEPPPEPQA